MMKLFSRLAVRAALCTGFALAAAAPTQAQAAHLAYGHGSFVSTSSQLTHQIAFSVVQLPNGATHGHAIGFEAATHGFVFIDLSSAMFLGDTLAVAGTITMAINMPPQFPVGGTAFFAVQDNAGGPDLFAGLGSVPPQLGNLTIQQILALIGPPPPQAYAPLINGNFRIF
jgi:hypothetical protein